MTESQTFDLSCMPKSNDGNDGLQLSPIRIKDDYRKKWNISPSLHDFVCLTRNGELVSESLYRVGGLDNPDLKKDKYFMLIKHVEAFYSKEILRMSKSTDARHLEGRWCIIDRNGDEKVEFPSFKHGYLINDSCLYSIDSNYYNIETGEHYGYASSSMKSKEFVFLDTRFSEDAEKIGVMKINKKDGTWELFS